ncbi:MAG: hypothetical protein KBS98_06830, partial [Flavobacterium sp.]|nr:hypothetical protein [Candidatus Neoflavobacterium equi]
MIKKFTFSTLLKWCFVLFAMTQTLLVNAQSCEAGTATYATGGNSPYKDQVLWLTWGGSDTNNPYGIPDQSLVNGAKSKATFLVADKQLCVECELITSSDKLFSYR